MLFSVAIAGIYVVDEAAAKLKLEITSKPIASDEIDRSVLQLQMKGFGRALRFATAFCLIEDPSYSKSKRYAAQISTDLAFCQSSSLRFVYNTRLRFD
ncbi:hypothetical protein Tco_0845954 [Tanacetum coccineum]